MKFRVEKEKNTHSIRIAYNVINKQIIRTHALIAEFVRMGTNKNNLWFVFKLTMHCPNERQPVLDRSLKDEKGENGLIINL